MWQCGGKREKEDRKTVMAWGAMPAGYGWIGTHNTCRPSQRWHLDTAFTPPKSQSPSAVSWNGSPALQAPPYRPLSPPLSPIHRTQLIFPNCQLYPRTFTLFTILTCHFHFPQNLILIHGAYIHMCVCAHTHTHSRVSHPSSIIMMSKWSVPIMLFDYSCKL